MKKICSLILPIITGICVNAQTSPQVPTEIEYSVQSNENNANNPCITPEEYRIIEQRCIENSKLFTHKGPSVQAAPTNLIWPLKAKPGFNDCSYYFVAAYVDQDKASGSVKDFSCGSNTYDGHTGTDIAIGPFPFYKMDSDQVEVIAAAAGTIADKHDGEYDRNCVGSGSGLTANYVIIQHSDGSYALYWHMKKNSLTSKAIGQTVAAGEHIGVVGSSGSSSGPHLHFEVRTGGTVATINDPFSGACNTLNASSWWAAQKPSTEPGPIKASVHTTDIVTPQCATETPNESTTYTIPFQGAGLNPGYAKFYTFIRNATAGGVVNMSILNPDATVFNSWNYTLNTTGKLSYLGFSKLLPTKTGVYTYQAAYSGVTCVQNFTILNPTGITETQNHVEINIYPNPFNSLTTVQVDHEINNGELAIYNGYGQVVLALKNISGNEIKLTRNNLSAGLYFLRLTEGKEVFTDKLIVTDY